MRFYNLQHNDKEVFYNFLQHGQGSELGMSVPKLVQIWCLTDKARFGGIW